MPRAASRGSRPVAPTGRRRLSFGGSAIAIEWEGDRARELVDFTFSRVPSARNASPRAVFRLSSSDTGRLNLFKDDALVCRSVSEEAAVSVLMDQAGDALTRTSAGGLLLHAAAVAHRGRTIVMPAASGHGKTTLAAWLSAGDFQCLTDELVYVPEKGRRSVPFARPLRLRSGSRSILSDRFGRWPPAEPALCARETCIVPIAAIGAPEPAMSTIGLFVFPRYDAAGSGCLQPLSRATAALKILSTVLNGGSLEARGVHEASRLARTIRAFEISYSDCGQVEAELLRVLD
jgi:hypothetical protein